jgi:hypothetical protein
MDKTALKLWLQNVLVTKSFYDYAASYAIIISFYLADVDLTFWMYVKALLLTLLITPTANASFFLIYLLLEYLLDLKLWTANKT